MSPLLKHEGGGVSVVSGPTHSHSVFVLERKQEKSFIAGWLGGLGGGAPNKPWIARQASCLPVTSAEPEIERGQEKG